MSEYSLKAFSGGSIMEYEVVIYGRRWSPIESSIITFSDYKLAEEYADNRLVEVEQDGNDVFGYSIKPL